MKKLQIFVLTALVSASVYAQPYQWDTRFGTNGFSIGPNQVWADYTAQDIHLVDDCKAIVGSYVYGPGGEAYISLSRYNLSDGSVDGTFGDGREMMFSFNFRTHMRRFFLQPDKKIVVAGDDWSSNSSATYRGDIFRIKANGKGMDSTFGTNGRFKMEYDGVSSGSFVDAILQPDGKIVATGFTTSNVNGGSYSFVAVRLKPNGTLDSTYGVNGRYRNLTVNGTRQSVQYPDGAVLSVLNMGTLGFIKLKTNGTPDSTFGIHGLTSPGIVIQGPEVPMVLQPDGKFVVDFRDNDNNTAHYVIRYKPNGSPDSSFGTNGVKKIDFAALQEYPHIGGMKLQADGKMVISTAFASRIVLVRLKTDGSLDSSFGNQGFFVRPIPVTHRIFSPELDDKGNIWLCGQKNNDLSFMAKVTQNPGFLVPVNLGDDSTHCGNPPITLNATTVEATNYLWGNGSTSPTFQVTANGSYSVLATNSANKCFGKDTVSVSFVTVVVPVITPSGNLLTTSGTGTKQWFLNNNPIPGATGNSISVSISGPGIYTVTLTNSGCTGTSLPFVVTGVETLESPFASIYPNPAPGAVSIRVSPDFMPYRLTVYDLAGKVLQSFGPESVPLKRVELAANAGSVLMLKLETRERVILKKVVVDK